MDRNDARILKDPERYLKRIGHAGLTFGFMEIGRPRMPMGSVHFGRSDDTLKVAGKRVGPAEVESVLVAHAAVSEAGVIRVPDELKGEALVCFLRSQAWARCQTTAASRIERANCGGFGQTICPRELKFVQDLPKTRNAKVMRRVIRAAYLGHGAGYLSALENPAAIQEIRQAR